MKWGIDERTGAPVLLAAGLEGVCKVLDCNTQKLLWASRCLHSLPSRLFVGATASDTLREMQTFVPWLSCMSELHTLEVRQGTAKQLDISP